MATDHCADKMVTLNVGGTLYTTTISTLTKHQESMLGAMFSGNYSRNLDEQGNTFIDRDGKLFRYVLNFLRDGTLSSPPESLDELEQLKSEANFYQITPLIEQLRGRRQKLPEKMHDEINGNLSEIAAALRNLPRQINQNHLQLQGSLSSMSAHTQRISAVSEALVVKLQANLQSLSEVKNLLTLVAGRL